jgi:SAM-dependent methyltransferase
VARFVERCVCSVCGEIRHETVRSVGFTAPEVWDFLGRYYAGRIAPAELEGSRFEVRRCSACGFLWQAFHLDPEGMRRLYEEWISEEESLAKKTRADVSLFDGYAREISGIARRLGRRPCELSVLDFGMGWGAWCRMAQAYGYEVTGFELSRSRRDYARARGIRVVDSLEALERFDYVNCHHTLEHVPDPRETLERIAGALAPGGLLHLCVPDGRDAERRLREPGWHAAKDALHPLEHLSCFTAGTLERLAAGVGLAPAPEPSLPARSRARRLARRAAAALRPARAEPPGNTTGCFVRLGAA